MNLSIRRLSSATALSVLCACTIGASLAWACVPRDWGWSPPGTPDSTPTAPTDVSGAGGSAESAPSSSLTPAEASPSQPARTQSPSRQPSRSPARTPAKQPAQAPTNTPSGAFNGPSSSGVAPQSSGVQSSGAAARTPPSRSTGSGRTPAALRGSAKQSKKTLETAPTPSERTAQAVTDGDAWSAARGNSASLMSSASDPAVPSAGAQLGLGAGLLGLGLVGLLGGLAVAAIRRGRASARAQAAPARTDG